MKKQILNIKDSGSLVNWMMANNSSLPEVGKGATILLYSDRHAYEVISVSDNGKEVSIKRYVTKRIDKNGMGDSQDYEYSELADYVSTIVFRNGKWKRKTYNVVFIDKKMSFRDLTDEQKDAVYLGSHIPINVVEGITKIRYDYSAINIIWGVKEEFYDFTR